MVTPSNTRISLCEVAKRKQLISSRWSNDASIRVEMEKDLASTIGAP
jgi:hypothetical protein